MQLLILSSGILVYEAKLSQPFNIQHLKRTKNISEIWSKLLFHDLGFIKEPQRYVYKLCLEKK